MKPTPLLFAILLVTGSWPAFTASAADTPATCHAQSIAVAGNGIWVDMEGRGETTVVFEAGFGNDSSVWSAIVPRIQALGVRTLIYDRAGMGKSTINTTAPYSLDNDTRIIGTVLSLCNVHGPIVFVGHSYGGAIGLDLASGDPDVKGLVLLDAVVPGVWTDDEVARNLTAMRPQYDELRKQAPELAKVAIPFAEAMPKAAHEINSLNVSEDLPIIDIKAENGQTEPLSAATWLKAHQDFTTGHAHRTYVLANGSSHKVMADQPDLVVDAIATMVRMIAK